MPLTVTVSQLNRYVKSMLDGDRNLSGVFVQGEISNFRQNFRSGHCYFSLKDAQASVRAVLFRSYAEELRFLPEDGMAVLVQGNLSLYERDGTYQLYVTDLQPDGAGAMAVALEQRRQRLREEGLFDERLKKPLPQYPARIGVVTSKTGAALHDIQQVLARRYPIARLVLCPAAVQGESAPNSLVHALRTLDTDGRCDVILLARGGGSAEDLSAFNEEALARAVFAVKTPIVSAVGHETDFTICDLVADMRAPTPSAAAELVSPSTEQLAGMLASAADRLRDGVQARLDTAETRLSELENRWTLRDPQGLLLSGTERLHRLAAALERQSDLQFRERRAALVSHAKLLESYHPMHILERGYCMAQQNGTPVLSAKALEPDTPLTVHFRDGWAETSIQRIEERNADEENHNI